MSIADVEKPLLHHEEEKSSRLLVQIAFAIIGLATSVLWNQLMLCVVVLTQLFGKSALAEAATAQNACCAAAMMVLTFGQRLLPAAQMTGKGRLLLCAASLFAMFSFGFVLASMVYHVDGAHEVFLLVVALNGLCTGMSQNLAASISTIYPGASGALLFGESMSPLVAVVISCITELSLQRNQRFAQAAAWTLVQAQAFVLVALLACLYLWLHGDAAAKPAQTVAECILEGGPAREYVLHRVAQLLCNAVVAFCCCCAWVFLLCTSPFIAEGLCGSKALCSSLLPQRMISISNMAATFGRLMGLKVGTQWLPSLVLESLMLLCFVLLLVFACIGGRLVEASFTAALATGLTMFGGLTLWSNFLLMRNDHSAQKSCGHSVILPCHVTTEVMWLAIQVGSIAGTCLAASL